MITLHRFAAFLFLAVTTTSLSSCFKKDECKKVSCHNGGVCVDGLCDCTGWFEGSDCATPERQKYLTTDATVISDDCTPGAGSYLIDITAGDVINHFWFEGFMNEPLKAELTGSSTFFVPSQNFNNDSITVHGSGTYQNVPGNEVNIVLNYTLTRNWLLFNNTFNCTAFIHNQH